MITDYLAGTGLAREATPLPAARSASGAKVAFFGIFGVQNLGNECTLQAIVHHGRRWLGEAEFFAISFQPEDTIQRHQLRAVAVTGQDYSRTRAGPVAKIARILFRRLPGELRDWWEAVRALRGTDLMVMTGTGMLTDYSTTAFGFPYHIFRWTLAARIAGCRVRFAGVGVGPIYSWLSRRFIRWSLALADYRSFRDEFSRSRISGIFDSSRDPVFPDLAFSLPGHLLPPRRRREQGQLRVGVGVMNHRDVHALTVAQQEAAHVVYLEKMCDFIEWLLGQGYAVRILQGDAKHDAAARDALRCRLGARGIRYGSAGIVDEGSSSVAQLLEQLAQSDIVISSRFHNLLLGLMMKIPGISISYDPKNDRLLESFGLGRYCQRMETLDVELLIAQFRELIGCDGLSSRIAATARKYRELLDKQYEWIFSDCCFTERRRR